MVTGFYPFERLEVYQLALEFRNIVEELIRKYSRLDKDDIDQILRSIKSTIRNICEGAGEWRPVEKARFYRMALRSATESGGTLRIMEHEVGNDVLFDRGHEVNQKLVAKLTALSIKKLRK